MSQDVLRRARVHTNGKFVCMRDFRCSGKDYRRGEVFDWRKRSMSERRVIQLWEGRFIAPEEVLDEEPLAETRKVVVEPEKPVVEADEAEDKADEEDDADDHDSDWSDI